MKIIELMHTSLHSVLSFEFSGGAKLAELSSFLAKRGFEWDEAEEFIENELKKDSRIGVLVYTHPNLNREKRFFYIK